jgi:hypothetical protein
MISKSGVAASEVPDSSSHVLGYVDITSKPSERDRASTLMDTIMLTS